MTREDWTPKSLKVYPDPETRQMLEELARKRRRSLNSMTIESIRETFERDIRDSQQDKTGHNVTQRHSP